MNRRNAAFTLIELMIALAIVMVVLYAAINFFIVSVRQYKVQTKITETNVEGILGLELFRQDLESLGLRPAVEQPGCVHREDRRECGDRGAQRFVANAPRAVLSVDGATFTVNNSDYLVIKSARVGMSDAAGKWTTLTQANVKRTWNPADGEPRKQRLRHRAGAREHGCQSPVPRHVGHLLYAVQQHGGIRPGGTVLGEYRLRDRQCDSGAPVQSRGILHRQHGGTAALCAEHRGPGEGRRGARRVRDHADAAPVARLRRRHAGSVRTGQQRGRGGGQHGRPTSPRG